jgi:hypothetical protein
MTEDNRGLKKRQVDLKLKAANHGRYVRLAATHKRPAGVEVRVEALPLSL